MKSKCIVEEFIEGDEAYLISIVGQTSPETYGTIYSLRRNESKTSAGDLDFPIGLLILEIQDRMLDFLVKCAKGALQDIAPDDLFSDEYPVQETLPILTRDPSEAVTIVALSEGRQYQVPHAMDFDALRDLVEAKRGDCEDHIWALREDPGYLLETAISRCDHRQESVLDRKWEEHPFKCTRILWDRILTNLVQETSQYLMSWTLTADYIERIAKLHEKHANRLAIDKPLPAELEKGLLSYREFITLALDVPKLQLCSAVPGSPELRSY